MGSRYSKYLDEFSVAWDFYDPFVSGGIYNLSNLDIYNKVIISTPSEVHYDMYQQIINLGFKGRVYIDKPVVTKYEHLDVCDHIFCGMTERYNPAVIQLKKLLDPTKLVSLQFTRLSLAPETFNIPVLFDLGIHDLDLYFFLMNLYRLPKKYYIFQKSRSCFLFFESDNNMLKFLWSHESQKRERKIIALQENVIYDVDLINQTILVYESDSVIKNIYVNKDQPLRLIMKHFLKNDKCNATLAHKFMLKIYKS